jgi:hypothetical protein
MTLEKAIELLTSSFGENSAEAGDELRIAREMAIDALSSVKNIRGSCGACLPYLLIGETPVEELK